MHLQAMYMPVVSAVAIELYFYAQTMSYVEFKLMSILDLIDQL
jgi:hypothetical protein